MEKFSCLIVEDEPLAAEVLQDYIQQVPFLECKAVCRDGIYAMQALQETRIDVLFLDIHLPKIRGLDFLKTLKTPPQVIITTAYREYAIDGYELNVVDYLLKPISFSRFLAAVNKLKGGTAHDGSLVKQSLLMEDAESRYLLVNSNKKRIKVTIKDIFFIESRKEYICLFVKGESLLTKIPLHEIELQLPKEKFLRVHRSFIVAIDKISAFTAVAVEIGDRQIPIGRSYRELTLQILSGNHS